MQSNINKVDTVILGAGASGLMCAKHAAGSGHGIAVVDHSTVPARKVLVSGGGRCNYTNLNADNTHYISSNPRFSHSALARYTPEDALAFLDTHNIKYEVREAGRVFLKRRASEVVDALISDCEAAGVNIALNADIASVGHNAAGFTVKTSKGVFDAKRLVIALGGKSCKSTGATGFGYKLARQFGHEVTELRPGLVPFVFQNKNNPFKGLSGISFRGEVTVGRHSFTDEVLVTHQGLSGPAILQAASFWLKGGLIKLNFLPDVDAISWLMEHRSRKIEFKTLLASHLPNRLALALSESFGGSDPMNSYADKTLHQLAGKLSSMEIRPDDTDSFNHAEVTVGGVDTRGVSSKTMESRIIPGLYLIGEVLDVTGQLGGYNLHWAWASAHAAGKALSGA